MGDLSEQEIQALIWDYYKPRHTHTWNMLVLSWRELDQWKDNTGTGFEVEYFWENFILRLWLYRTTVKTLAKLATVRTEALTALRSFDEVFQAEGQNSLKAVRDMIEHFDDYAAGDGRGPATRDRDLDPWRMITRDRYERGRFVLDRRESYDAAIKLRSDAKGVSDVFIQRCKSLG
ncbi:MAG: hypothetical protein Kow00114_15910 [Kiloniellaceae bacterium]